MCTSIHLVVVYRGGGGVSNTNRPKLLTHTLASLGAFGAHEPTGFLGRGCTSPFLAGCLFRANEGPYVVVALLVSSSILASDAESVLSHTRTDRTWPSVDLGVRGIGSNSVGLLGRGSALLSLSGCRFRAKREQLEIGHVLLPESQGKNVASKVSCVLYSLDSWSRHPSTRTSSLALNVSYV